jgi:transketolase
MTHKALRIAQRFLSDGVRIGVIDMYLLNPIQDEKLSEALTKYETVLTLEEAFVGKGGLDSIIRLVAAKASLSCKVQGLGLKDEYLFEMGGREHLHHLCGIGEDDIADIIRSCM